MGDADKPQMSVSCCSVEQGIDSQGQTCELCFPLGGRALSWRNWSTGVLKAPGGIDGQMVQEASDADSNECLSGELQGGRKEAAEL